MIAFERNSSYSSYTIFSSSFSSNIYTEIGFASFFCRASIIICNTNVCMRQFDVHIICLLSILYLYIYVHSSNLFDFERHTVVDYTWMDDVRPAYMWPHTMLIDMKYDSLLPMDLTVLALALIYLLIFLTSTAQLLSVILK